MVNHPNRANFSQIKGLGPAAESIRWMPQRLTLHDEICKRIVDLAPEPVAVRVLEVLRNGRAPIQSLADVITADPLLAASVLRLTNLATGQPQTIDTISHRSEEHT